MNKSDSVYDKAIVEGGDESKPQARYSRQETREGRWIGMRKHKRAASEARMCLWRAGDEIEKRWNY